MVPFYLRIRTLNRSPFACASPYGSVGYSVYRINDHGPGEHGKDIILAKYVPHFLTFEYLAVQAKAEVATASNAHKFSGQIIRSLSVPFPQRSGGGNILPNGALFINARRHSNDAEFSFPSLIYLSQFVRILEQENVCDLILNSGLGPRSLISTLSHASASIESQEDQDVYNILTGGDPMAIEHLMERKLPLIRDDISLRIRHMVIDAIYLRWQQDRSWPGTVKPMKWLDTYYSFVSTGHGGLLLDVLDEFLSSTPSFDASTYVYSIVSKMTPEQIHPIADRFICLCAEKETGFGRKENLETALKKLEELSKSTLADGSAKKSLMDRVLELRTVRKTLNKEKESELSGKIRRELHPDEFESLT